MKFRNVIDRQDFSDVLKLYTDSFPENERRLYSGVSAFMDFADRHGDRFNILIAENEEGRFMGFITYWEFDRFVYVEHFAVETSMRGTGVGTELLSYLKNISDRSLLLEVEPPVDEMTRKRIGFYEKNGFRLFDGFRYIQPPYGPGQSGMELKLMLYGPYTPASPSELAEFHRIVYDA